jgi:hypothetical protein
MFEQVGVEQFKNKAVVLPKEGLIHHSDDVVLVLWVLLHNVPQILSFFMSKLMVHLCISGDLHGINWLFRIFVVLTLDHLSEGAFAKNLHDLVSVGDMLSDLNLEITFKIVKDWISLKLSIRCILLLPLFQVKCFDPFFINLFKHRQIFLGPLSDGAREVNSVELSLSSSKLCDFLLEHDLPVVSEKFLPLDALDLLTLVLALSRCFY